MCRSSYIQSLFLGICAYYGLTVYGGDTTDAYTHSTAPNCMYLSVDDDYVVWYKDNHKVEISKQLVLPFHHTLQGHPESGKKLIQIKMIDQIIIYELEFQTTMHNRCI